MSVIGTATPRVDGPAKVTGRARYGSDAPMARAAYAWLATSPIAKGRITDIDDAATRATPGVIDVITWREAGSAVKSGEIFASQGYMGSSIAPLAGPQILHAGQIVALVVAETLEAAREGAHLLNVSYAAEPPSATFDSPGTTEEAAKEASKAHEDPAVGDAEAAFAAAPVKVDARYSTPTQHHNPIELFTTAASWSGGKLTVWESSQNVWGYRYGLAEQLGLDPADVHVLSPFAGGAFGSRGSLTQRTALAALASKRLAGRPVKLMTTRQQGFTIATYRAETRHRVRLGAGPDGRLTALIHEGREVTSRPDPYMVSGTDASTRIWGAANVASHVSIVHADRNTPGFMRAPPETPYIFALESAMDELAYAAGVDPVALRLANDTQVEPIKGLKYTSRHLAECFREGAERFGWSRRAREPGRMRDGDWLVGYGCAASLYPTQVAPAAARVSLLPDGSARVAIATHEIGNGVITAVAMTAADRLGVPVEKVAVAVGDSELPPAPVAGGSNSTASCCNAVAQACDEIRAKIAQGRPTGAVEAYAEEIPHGVDPEKAKGLFRGKSPLAGGAKLKDRIQFAFGAQFIEARVHALTGEVRTPRAVGAFAAGTIVNPLAAKSQLMGGMIWGISAALHEATEIDERAARYVNVDLSGYRIPVNADVPEIEVIFVPEEDRLVNPLGIKGIGELGIVGMNAAVANAVFHATGVRIRDLPIRLENLLPALPRRT